MKKRATLLFIMVLSCAIAGTYGIINDYFLYKFCPEFFTGFKFIEYGVATDTASGTESYLINIIKVGLMASWWMGLIIGTILGVVSLPIPVQKTMFSTLFMAMGITIVITFFASMAGLAYGWLSFSEADIKTSVLFNGQKDLVMPMRFLMCFNMHNFSYVGAVIGMLAGSIFIIRKKRKLMYF